MARYIIGIHAVEEKIKNPKKNSILFVLDSKYSKYSSLIKEAKDNMVSVRRLDEKRFMALEGSSESRGLVFKERGSSDTKNFISVSDFISNLEEDKTYTVLVADKITDVNNLGAMLRSADQFSVDLVLIPSRRNAQLDANTIRISSGAALYLNIASITNINKELELLKENGFWIYAADMNGENLNKTNFAKRSVIIMGSEGKGLSPLVKENSDFIISIPTTGHIDSLNVSVATGIILYQRYVNDKLK